MNTFDSQTYDALIGAKAVIDTARAQYKSGALPAVLVPLVDQLSVAYNATFPAWRAWREAALANQPAAGQLLATLNAELAQLAVAIANVQRGK